MGSQSLALTREVNLAIPSSAPSTEVMIEFGRAFQFFIVLGEMSPCKCQLLQRGSEKVNE